MKELLSKKTIRHLNIVYELSVEKRTLTFHEIMNLNNCSHKTAYEDLNEIKKNYQDILKIQVENGLFFTLEATSSDIIFIKKDYYRKEIAIRLLQALFLFPRRKVADYANLLNVSESTILKRMKVINKYIKDFAKIKKEDEENIYYFQANDELHFQYFLVSVLLETEDRQTIDDYFPTIIDSEFVSQHQRYYNYLARKHHNFRPDLIEYQFRVLEGIEYLRYKQGFTISIDSLNECILEKQLDYNEQFQKYFDQFSKQHQINLSPKEKEYIIMILNIYSIKSSYIRISNQYKYNRYAIFAYQLEKDNPEIINTFKKQIADIDKSFQTNLATHINELLFVLYTNIQDLRMYRDLEVAIISDLGVEHAESLYIFCQKHFPIHHFLIIEEPSEETFHQFDYVITNSLFVQKQFKNKNFIRISDFPNHDDLKYLYQKLRLN